MDQTPSALAQPRVVAQTAPATAGTGAIPASARDLVGAEITASAGSWGWLPALTVFAAFGLLAVGQSMRLAQTESPFASLAFWVGLLLIYAPVVFRSAMPQVSRRERIALAVFLGVTLYLVKVLRAQGVFIFHDEFPHYDTANDILTSGALFSVNSLQEVSAYFPGLEIVAAAIAAMTNISIEASGFIVVGAARLIAALGIYLLYEEISGSPRVASIGSVLAIAYPNYTFWSSQFSYESLALPLSILTLLTALWSDRRQAPRAALLGLALLLVGSVVVIHHVTSYFLAASLILIYVVSRMRPFLVRAGEQLGGRVPHAVRRLLPWTLWRKPSERTTDPRTWGILALASVVGAGAWLWTAGREVLDYLAPHLEAASRGFVAIITRSGGPRTPFTTSGGAQSAPAWEQLAAFAAVLLIAAAIPFGLLQIWRRHRGHGLAVMFALASMAYPFTLVLRLARGGSEIANRSWDFLFVAIGFVLGVGIAELWMARERVYARAAAVALYACIAYTGAFVVGMPGWARLPGPHMVGGDTRGLQAESYELSDWARTTLGPGRRFVTDSTNKLLLGSYGEQHIIDGLSWVYISPQLRSTEELADMIRRDAHFIVVDDRVTQELPRQGFYFEEGEPERPHTEPFDPEKLAKFERATCLSRVYNSGHITVYAVSPTCAEEGGSQ